MIPELGYAAIVTKQVLAIYGSSAAAVSGFKSRRDFQLSSERTPIGVWLLTRHPVGRQVAA